MTRAEWIQRALLASIAQRVLDGPDVIQAVMTLADALEKSNAAPWTVPENVAPTVDVRAREQMIAYRAARDEREACAQIADRNDKSPWGIAQEIRGRGKPPVTDDSPGPRPGGDG